MIAALVVLIAYLLVGAITFGVAERILDDDEDVAVPGIIATLWPIVLPFVAAAWLGRRIANDIPDAIGVWIDRRAERKRSTVLEKQDVIPRAKVVER